MKKVTKLFFLILILISVYFIYNSTKNSKYHLLNIGDGLSQGINSYGVRDKGYIDYYKDYLNKKEKEVVINNKYSKKDMTISYLLNKLRDNSEIKKDLINSHQLIICLGYNDLLYKMSIEENIDNKKLNTIIKELSSDYNDLISEIRKYYKNKIVIVGYYKPNRKEYYLNRGIKLLNMVLKSNENVIYVDTYDYLDISKYLDNSSSSFPNKTGYYLISRKIIEKTLEK